MLFLQISKQLQYGIAPGVSFADRVEETHAFLMLKDPIEVKDFIVLWNLIEESDARTSETRLFPQPFTGNSNLKDFIEIAMMFNRSLFVGVSEVDAVVDDLQVSARNSQAMSDRGIITGVNSKKASKEGVSVDMFTVDPRLQIPCGFVLHDSDAKKSGENRATKVCSVANELRSNGTKVTVTLDRGLEGITQKLRSECV